ncbi:hypothetical protein PYCCODRAFT_1433653 [Trametes coccinea BRFM310]|uniref:Uncharacterized protein n=1 Tax=Trametes coccinea (strain BRFM310) TaxID=1353009 RepID=A0A1Y2IVP3_TRAC3|nr:hypothetical protein PYCCODRAFT_1433653 [Trametes coccinea BRFM310]
MTPLYPPAKDLQSIASLFPHVDLDVIASVVRHELPAIEVYKLDSRRILESTWNIVEVSMDDSTVSLCAAPLAIETYPSLDSLLVPLNAYFSILSVDGLSNGQSALLPCHFFRYSSHLVKIAAQYEWHAVLSYHFAFFARRLKEMRKGDFAGWGRVEMDLMEECLVPHQKKRPYGTVFPDSSTYQSWELIYP